MTSRRFRVVGAGVSGLSAAVFLARRGASVEVIARGPAPGGLAGSLTFRGVPCDVGSHRLHGDALRVPLLAEMAHDVGFVERPRRGVLVLRGGHVPYPPTVAGLVRGLGPLAAAGMAAGLLRARPWQAPPEDDVGFEAFVTRRVGRAAYESFYRPYVEKVWGLPAGEVSQTVARQRVSSVAPWSLLREGARREAATYLYPRGGFGTIAEWIARDLEKLRVSIRYGTTFDPENHVRDVERVLFAGNLRDLVPTPLEHRGIHLVFLAFDREPFGSAETYYVPGAEYWFGRVAEVGNYAPGRVPAGTTVLCVEVPDAPWGARADFTTPHALRELLDQLREARIVPRGAEPMEVRQLHVPDVYPLYRRGWRAQWERAMGAVTEGVVPFGRQGLFLHCNTDHCVAVADEAVAHAWAGGGTREWAARAGRFLALRVRD